MINLMKKNKKNKLLGLAQSKSISPNYTYKYFKYLYCLLL